jgi:uncharacterized protein YecT (DUF1311 family)
MRFKFILFLVLGFLASAAVAVVAQDKDGLTAEYSRCIDKAGGVDPAMLDCIDAETRRQDKRLNDVYKKLMSKLNPERKKQLLEAQRLWLKFTEANCSFYLDPDGGTAARLSASECPMVARARRATELELFLE